MIRVRRDRPAIRALLEARVPLARSDCPATKASKERPGLPVLQGRRGDKDRREIQASQEIRARAVQLE